MFVYGEMEKCLNPHVHGLKKKKDARVSIRRKNFDRQKFPEKDGLQGEPLQSTLSFFLSFFLSVFNQ